MITDIAFAYRKSATFHAVIDAHVISQKFIKPHCPCANGKVERLSRTLAAEWAYPRASKTDKERAQAVQSWSDYCNLERPHLDIGQQRLNSRIENGRGQ
ncbi:integrase core domain-containing protein [Flaviflexus salsibiostraticola]|uniref:integrase core domain-containing protein n=1 Tax=Flaviflexus salsibiostraticola TaxID=1282737 RepID=UPI0013DD903A|nr:integrase core domain-containing protein [Flaviflexus salsibiostraticola]